MCIDGNQANKDFFNIVFVYVCAVVEFIIYLPDPICKLFFSYGFQVVANKQKIKPMLKSECENIN